MSIGLRFLIPEDLGTTAAAAYHSNRINLVISLIVVVPACYVVSHFSKKKQYMFIMALFFTRMIPSVAVALPISVYFIKLGLLDTIPGLVFANLICQIPFMAWMLVSTFTAIPYDLEEAAKVDGASKLRVVVSIVLPLAKQGIASICHVRILKCME